MNPLILPTIVAVAVTIILFVQGIYILAHAANRQGDKWIGWLTILIAAMVATIESLFFVGDLVLSPEFAIVMVQGDIAWYALAAVLIAFSIGVGMAWYVNQLAAGWQPSPRWLLTIGAVVGLVTTLRIASLAPDDLTVQVYRYDLWWPLLMIWFGTALVDVGFNIIRLGGPRGRVWVKRFLKGQPSTPGEDASWKLLVRWWGGTVLLSLLALRALSHPPLSDLGSTPIWQGFLLILLPINTILAIWLAIETLGSEVSRVRWWIKLPLIVIPGSIGFLSAAFFVDNTHNITRNSLGWWFWIGWSALVLGVVVMRIVRAAWRNGKLNWQNGIQWLVTHRRLELRQTLLFIAVVSLVSSVSALLLDAVSTGPTIGLIAFTVAWMMLTEVMTDGVLYDGILFVRRHHLRDYGPLARQTWASVSTRVRGSGSRLRTWAKGLFSLPSVGVALVKALVVVACLIALNEIPNAGKTILQPFQAPGMQNGDALGQRVSDRVLNALDQLNQQLQPATIIPGPGSNGKVIFVNIGTNADAMEAGLAKVSDIEIGGVKIPIGSLVAPIQNPLRALLNVRVINGSLQADQSGYTILATSTRHESWTVGLPHKTVDLLIHDSNGTISRKTVPLVLANDVPEYMNARFMKVTTLLDTAPMTLSTSLPLFVTTPMTSTAPTTEITNPSTTNIPGMPFASNINYSDITIAPEGASGLAGPLAIMMTDQDQMVAVMQTPKDADMVAGLADELAFQMISSDSTLASTGMTKSWEAFQLFKSGLDSLQKADAGDYNALDDAINQFREATRKDPSFALAYYRLGLALQRDGQPGAATSALRSSIQDSPNFVPALNTLAYNLASFDTYYPSTAAFVPPKLSSTVTATLAYTTEARLLWQQIVDLPSEAATATDRASAYYGLCNNALYQDNYTLSYFYCRLAQRIYIGLPSEQRSDTNIKQAEASVLNNLGVILARSNSFPILQDGPPWVCDTNSINKISSSGEIIQLSLQVSPYISASKDYYDEAQYLQSDDSVIRCNDAITAYILNNRNPMERMDKSDTEHIILARNLHSAARSNSYTYYRAAIKEFQRAIDINPLNTDALNGYAYTFWDWRVNMSAAKPPEGPDAEIAHNAERYSRTAFNLVAGKGNKIAEAQVRDTLGDVLLGQGRSQEARSELKQTVDEAGDAIQSHDLDEIRWDLAQADLCAANDMPKDSDPTQVKKMKDEAQRYLDQIRRNEQGREFQPFTEAKQLGLDGTITVCNRDPEHSIEIQPSSQGTKYVLNDASITYDTIPNCNSLTFFGYAQDKDKKYISDVYIHAWGGGVDEYYKIGPNSDETGPYAYIFLSTQPQDTHSYYFVQLEKWDNTSEQYKPLSEVRSVDTFKNGSDGTCPKNAINILFVQQ